ncbi:MAG TPA: hypothetical protein VMN03_11680 [Burkholderiales bacterium]|nr:hypothetical protein [Burkholderiales bacterium]
MSATLPVSPAARSELAPAGRLRAGINYGNVILAARDHPGSGELRGVHAAFELFAAKRLDALVGLRPRLAVDSEMMPGSRVVDGRFMRVEQSIASRRGRDAGAEYLRGFVADLKLSGMIAAALERNGVRGVAVAS